MMKKGIQLVLEKINNLFYFILLFLHIADPTGFERVLMSKLSANFSDTFDD